MKNDHFYRLQKLMEYVDRAAAIAQIPIRSVGLKSPADETVSFSTPFGEVDVGCVDITIKGIDGRFDSVDGFSLMPAEDVEFEARTVHDAAGCLFGMLVRWAMEKVSDEMYAEDWEREQSMREAANDVER